MSNTRTRTSSSSKKKPAKRKPTSRRRASSRKSSVKEQFTAVRTGYARVALLLLAANLLLTGYCISKLSPKEDVAEVPTPEQQVVAESSNGS